MVTVGVFPVALCFIALSQDSLPGRGQRSLSSRYRLPTVSLKLPYTGKMVEPMIKVAILL